jgi:hypothetical protein
VLHSSLEVFLIPSSSHSTAEQGTPALQPERAIALWRAAANPGSVRSIMASFTVFDQLVYDLAASPKWS